MLVDFNGRSLSIGSLEQLSAALDGFDSAPVFDLACRFPAEGPILSMLRNGDRAWLMYMTEPGDPGFCSQGDASLQGTASYALSNGQLDEYPIAWCIPVEDCYKAIAYFYVNRGARPDWLRWKES